MKTQSSRRSLRWSPTALVVLALGTAGGCFDPDDDDGESAIGGSTDGDSSDGGSTDPTGGPGPGTTTTEDGSTSSDTTMSVDDTTTDDTATDGSTTGDAATETGGPLQAGGTIIPLYTYPTDPTWMTVATAKQDHPEVGVVAIINPDSGPGMMANLDYDTGITALGDAGVVVIGYVYTSYAARPLGDVEADITAYANFYPQLDGIMFDEMSNVPGNEGYYAGLSTFASGLGLAFTVGNPGVGVPESYVDTMDTLFVYESVGLPDPDTLGGWTDAYDRDNFAIIPHSVPSLQAGFVSAALGHVGWIYVTDDMLPNPWDSLPSYFDALVGELETG